MAWARAVARRLERLGGPFAVRTSERGIELHAATDEGARLELAIDRKHLEVSLDLEGPALAALHAIAHDEARVAGFVRMLGALPEQLLARGGGFEQRVSMLDRAGLSHLVDAALGQSGLHVGWKLPRGVVLSHAASIDEQLADALTALALLEAAIAGRTPRPSLAAQRLGAPMARGARLGVSGSTRMRTRAGGPRLQASTQAVAGVIEGGTKVRVLAGPFEGKTGVVQSLDGKGGARVMFGLLATRVELGDLATERSQRGAGAQDRRERPAITTSHRRS